ncbi:MAG: PAS domain S-box protein, partial [Methylomonas sp.]|nr:PAS domain S-box protein [Methylomonas sp.]
MMTLGGRQQPRLIESILDVVTDGVLAVDECGFVLYANAMAYSLLGRDDLVGKNCGLPAVDSPECADVQLVRSSGIVWAQLRALPIRWHDQAAHVITLTDITERKRAEENLRITAGVFENSQEAILITDCSNKIVDVNPAFSRITGYGRDEVLGCNPSLLNSGRQHKAFYAEMWRILVEQGAWRGEIWNRRKSGEIYAELLSISVIRGAGGQVQRYVAVFSDISYLKEHEAKLHHIAHYDALTGVANRLLLADRIKQA